MLLELRDQTHPSTIIYPSPPLSMRKMFTHRPRQEFTLNAPPPNVSLQESIAHLQRQHTVELPRQLWQSDPPLFQASLSTFTSCTMPASFRARSRFLNLRDSVKKSPTKSTTKVVSSKKEVPWVPFVFTQVLQFIMSRNIVDTS